jgi:hypothetical protein
MDGLLISIHGGRTDAGSVTYEIEVAELTPTPEKVPLMTCSFTPAADSPELHCSSVLSHAEFGDVIQIRDAQLKNVVVTISRDGAKLAEQNFQPVYTSREINGEGCGVCTNASATVNIPE